MKMIYVKSKKERRLEDLKILIRVTGNLLDQANLLATTIDLLTDLSRRERESFNNIILKIIKKKSDYESLLSKYQQSTKDTPESEG